MTTVQLSCSYSPTSFELLKHLYNNSKVYRELEQVETHDKSLTPIIDAMKQKILKYWEDIPLLAIIASWLNSAYKNPKFDEMFNIYNSRMVDN
jgi:hypothetical protein